MSCLSCGHPLGAAGCYNPDCPSNPNRVHQYEPFKIWPEPRMGWICPVCGGGVSPFVDNCPCKVDFTVTSK